MFLGGVAPAESLQKILKKPELPERAFQNSRIGFAQKAAFAALGLGLWRP
jgi:hypothetical protein